MRSMSSCSSFLSPTINNVFSRKPIEYNRHSFINGMEQRRQWMSSSSSSKSTELNSTSSSNNNDDNNSQQLLPQRAQLLPNVLRYRGSVDQGYGRGGKKLGVPTANLPSSLFQNALEDITTGVYFGWATLERSSSSNEVYKTVVNVGYSPTFEGQENSEKIIEAHLILDKNENDNSDTTATDDDSSSSSSIIDDFYGVPMRLQLVGFLRQEKKFDSFPELIAQINADVHAHVGIDLCNQFWKAIKFLFFP